MKNCTNLLIIIVLTTLLTVGNNVLAQDYDVKSFHGQVPTSEELINSLQPDDPGNMMFRGIRPVNASKPKAVALAIQFEFGSAELDSEAMATLDNLGRALTSQTLDKKTFMVEGHTDSIGEADFNQQLSEDRAESVKRYLMQHFGIASSRLETIGKGEDYPLDTNDPANGINRRVQIVTVR